MLEVVQSKWSINAGYDYKAGLSLRDILFSHSETKHLNADTALEEPGSRAPTAWQSFSQLLQPVSLPFFFGDEL